MIENVLIVDDDPSILMLLPEVLEFPDHVRILKADSIHKARELCEIFKPEIIICDFQLADGTGKDLLIHLTRLNLKTSFVLFTGTLETIRENTQDILTYSINGKDLRSLKNTIDHLIPFIMRS